MPTIWDSSFYFRAELLDCVSGHAGLGGNARVTSWHPIIHGCRNITCIILYYHELSKRWSSKSKWSASSVLPRHRRLPVSLKGGKRVTSRTKGMRNETLQISNWRKRNMTMICIVLFSALKNSITNNSIIHTIEQRVEQRPCIDSPIRIGQDRWF